MPRARVLVATVALWGVPCAAMACPVCGLAGTADTWTSYLSMTVMLSTVPLTMIGGIAFWVSRRARRQR